MPDIFFKPDKEAPPPHPANKEGVIIVIILSLGKQEPASQVVISLVIFFLLSGCILVGNFSL